MATWIAGEPRLELYASVTPVADDGTVTIAVHGSASAGAGVDQITVFVNGAAVAVKRFGDAFTAKVTLHSSVHTVLHSRWRGPYGSIVSALARDTTGAVAGAFTVVGGTA